jgi:hypothetical protein
MKKHSDLAWELGITMVAFAGGFTLLEPMFPDWPKWVFGGLFVVAFIIMMVSFFIRWVENQHPVKMVAVKLLIDTLDKPEFDITIGFLAREKVNIQSHAYLRFSKELDSELNQILYLWPFIQLADDTIHIEAGDYKELHLILPVDFMDGKTKSDLMNIRFIGHKVELGWTIKGENQTWTRVNCFSVMPLTKEDIKKIRMGETLTTL